MIPADARAAVLMRIADLRSGVDAHEHAVVLADGTVGWHQWTNHAIVDDHGQLVELQGVGRDITDQSAPRKRSSSSKRETAPCSAPFPT